MKALADYQKQIEDISNKVARSPDQTLGLPGGARVVERLEGCSVLSTGRTPRRRLRSANTSENSSLTFAQK